MMYVWSKLRIYLAFCKGAVRHALTFSWGKKIKVKKIVYLGLLGKCVQVAGLLRRCHFAKLSWGSCCSRVKRQNFGILPKPGIQHSMSYKLQSCSLCGKFYPLASPTCISCGNVSDCLRAPTAPLPWNFFQLGDFQNDFTRQFSHCQTSQRVIPPIWSSNSTYMRLESNLWNSINLKGTAG